VLILARGARACGRGVGLPAAPEPHPSAAAAFRKGGARVSPRARLWEPPQDLRTFLLVCAQASHKPVILMKPFGVTQEVPKAILDLADEVVEWDERALVDAIRRQARHEETTRWDTIEFKLEW